MDEKSFLPEIYLTGHQKEIYPWIQENLRTPFWRCYWNVTPGGCFRIGKNMLRLRTDIVYIIPGNFQFSTFAEQPFEQFYIHFNPPEKHFPADCGILTAPVLSHWKKLWHVWEELENAPPPYRFRREMAAEAILTEALLQHPAEIMLPKQEMSPEIESVTNWIRNHISHPSANPELAAFCRMDLRTFLRKFHAETGETPQMFCRRLRIETACRLLTYSRMTIDEIAEKTGFPDRYYFTRVFFQLQQISPARFRRAQQTAEVLNRND